MTIFDIRPGDRLTVPDAEGPTELVTLKRYLAEMPRHPGLLLHLAQTHIDAENYLHAECYLRDQIF